MNIPPLLTSCQIIENKEIIPGFFLLRLDSPELASRVIPGQFFHIRIEDRLDIILRRPFSVFNYNEKGVSILYEVVGKGTAIMSKKKPGEELDILGPLGNGFTLPIDARNVIIVGGGIGIAPLFCWTRELIRKKLEIQVLIGAKNRYKILCEEDFKDLGLNPEISTDDGSYGYKGFVTGLFKKQETINEKRETVVYACGPNNMLKELSGMLIERNIKGEISMDRHMGCGMGVCLGCVIKTVDGKYKRVCREGPVFKIDEVVLL